VIEGCDVFDTVKETGDHGSFNSWGRDRYWGLTDVDEKRLGEYALLDAVEPTIIRNSRWRCDHGWDIDLDDGSSHYVIRNNLTLRGGIKLREGFRRVVENNILVNNSFHPHVWYPGSGDIFRRNIVFTEYKPIRVPVPWGAEIDNNLLHRAGRGEPVAAGELKKQSGRDEHSLAADARFSDEGGGSFRLRGDSPALELGFEPFALDRFGVQWPKLKALARTPEMAAAATSAAKPEAGRDASIAIWLGARVRNLIGQGEMSAAGAPGETGVLVLEVPAQSRGALAGRSAAVVGAGAGVRHGADRSVAGDAAGTIVDRGATPPGTDAGEGVKYRANAIRASSKTASSKGITVHGRWKGLDPPRRDESGRHDCRHRRASDSHRQSRHQLRAIWHGGHGQPRDLPAQAPEGHR
jgi:hypothetical protein